MLSPNVDLKTVAGFGQEWTSFDQSDLDSGHLRSLFDKYFKIFPWASIDETTAVGADFGCGSGRWAKFVAPRVARLHLIDASSAALAVASNALADEPNVTFHCSSVEGAPLAENSLDFAYSLGVLHHLPDTQKAISDINKTLKAGAPFLVYLYYAFDQRPVWFRALWAVSDLIRKVICRLPYSVRHFLTQVIAGVIYWPLAKTGAGLRYLNLRPRSWPLAFYCDQPFYVMRNDALDRFGTRLEKRFTKAQITNMLTRGGFEKISFSDEEPYWCAVAYKKDLR